MMPVTCWCPQTKATFTPNPAPQCNATQDNAPRRATTCNFAAESCHTKKLCSRLFSREVEFYWHKQRYLVFVPPFVTFGLRGNVHVSSMARWKARGRLPISANWTFFASYHGWGTMSRYWWKFRCLKGGGHFERKFQGERGVPHQRILASEN